MIKLRSLYFKLAFLSAAAVAATLNAAELEGMNYKINELTPAKFSVSERNVLKERFIEFELLRDIPIPTGWKLNINWLKNSAFPIVLTDEGASLYLLSSDFVEIFESRMTNNYNNCDYKLVCDAAGSGTLRLGVYYYADKITRDSRDFQINAKQYSTFEFPITIADQLELKGIRPLLGWSGNLSIKDVKLIPTNIINENAIIEGELLQCSFLPDLEESESPDYFFAATLKVNSIRYGVPTPQNIKLIIPGFYDRKDTKLAALWEGDKLKLAIVPYDSLPEDKKSIPVADELPEESKALKSYFVVGAEIIPAFDTAKSGIEIEPSAE